MKQLFLIVTACVMCACTHVCTKDGQQVPEGNRYARGFVLRDSADCRVADIYSPWNRQLVMQHIVFRPDRKRGTELRLATTSCTQVGMLDAVGMTACIVGAGTRELVYTPLPDSVPDLGADMSPKYEQIVDVKPDLVLLVSYAEDNAMARQLGRLGIDYVYINEWMEQHPLGRAEWIRLVGLVTGCEREADSIFTEVCHAYEALAAQPVTGTRRSIFSGQDFRGTWYVPSGDTYMGQLFHDAGATYCYENDLRGQSIPLTLEQALQDFSEADVWVGCTAPSKEALLLIDERHSWLKAYRTGEVYNFYRRSTPTGGNDFWESGVVHPEEILMDLRQLLYPEQMPDRELKYALKLPNEIGKNEL